ncbi:MAG: hypothetical protein ABIL45_09640 [candidate division WOR-3 bacterium]
MAKIPLGKKDIHITLKRETYYALKEYIRNNNLGKKNNSFLIEKALCIFLGIEENKDQKIFNEVELLKKEVENLKSQIIKIDQEYIKKNDLLNLKYDIQLLRREISLINESLENKINRKISINEIPKIENNGSENKIENNKLPSFLKGNPWVEILQKRTKEKEALIYG